MPREPKEIVRYFDISDPEGLHPNSGPGWEKRRSDFFAKQFDDRRKVDGEHLPSLTEQHHKASCDINLMLSRYEENGIIPRGVDGQFFFGDFSNVPDFATAQIRVKEAMNSFMQLPASTRSRFDNDPHKLLEFMADPKNLKDSVDLGLVDFSLLPKDVQSALRPPMTGMGTPAETVPVPQAPVTSPSPAPEKK